MQQFIDFFSELVYRFFEKSPKFFRVIQKVALATAGISSATMYLNSIGKQLPNWLCVMDNISVFVTATVAAILARLPNENISE